MSKGESLEKNEWLVNQNDKYMFLMRNDGNLVLVDIDNQKRVLWESNTAGRGEGLVFETDGNLVIRDTENNIIWETKTNGRGELMQIDEDGFLVIYDSSQVEIWSTRPKKSLYLTTYYIIYLLFF